MKYLFIFLKYLLVVTVIVFAVSFYNKNQLVSIPNVHPATLKDPIQTPSNSKHKINFKNSGYTYVASPLFDYKITGIVVSKHDYDPADDDVEKVMRYDLCMVWRQNVSDNIYFSPKISFSQNQRFCNYSFSENIGFHADQISNNHLVTIDSSILEKIKTINTGDEVAITGQLINISAFGVGNGSSTPQSYNWNTSITRKDTGSGACEIIYIQSIEILTPVHKTDIQINTYSLWVIGGIVSLFFLRLLFFILFASPKRNSGRIR